MPIELVIIIQHRKMDADKQTKRKPEKNRVHKWPSMQENRVEISQQLYHNDSEIKRVM